MYIYIYIVVQIPSKIIYIYVNCNYCSVVKSIMPGSFKHRDQVRVNAVGKMRVRDGSWMVYKRSTNTSSTQNEDGSVTNTVTNYTSGVVTDTTSYLNGDIETVVHNADGSFTRTLVAIQGNVLETTTHTINGEITVSTTVYDDGFSHSVFVQEDVVRSTESTFPVNETDNSVTTIVVDYVAQTITTTTTYLDQSTHTTITNLQEVLLATIEQTTPDDNGIVVQTKTFADGSTEELIIDTSTRDMTGQLVKKTTKSALDEFMHERTEIVEHGDGSSVITVTNDEGQIVTITTLAPFDDDMHQTGVTTDADTNLLYNIHADKTFVFDSTTHETVEVIRYEHVNVNDESMGNVTKTIHGSGSLEISRDVNDHINKKVTVDKSELVTSQITEIFDHVIEYEILPVGLRKMVKIEEPVNVEEATKKTTIKYFDGNEDVSIYHVPSQLNILHLKTIYDHHGFVSRSLKDKPDNHEETITNYDEQYDILSIITSNIDFEGTKTSIKRDKHNHQLSHVHTTTLPDDTMEEIEYDEHEQMIRIKLTKTLEDGSVQTTETFPNDKEIISIERNNALLSRNIRSFVMHEYIHTIVATRDAITNEIVFNPSISSFQYANKYHVTLSMTDKFRMKNSQGELLDTLNGDQLEFIPMTFDRVFIESGSMPITEPLMNNHMYQTYIHEYTDYTRQQTTITVNRDDRVLKTTVIDADQQQRTTLFGESGSIWNEEIRKHDGDKITKTQRINNGDRVRMLVEGEVNHWVENTTLSANGIQTERRRHQETETVVYTISKEPVSHTTTIVGEDIDTLTVVDLKTQQSVSTVSTKVGEVVSVITKTYHEDSTFMIEEKDGTGALLTVTKQEVTSDDETRHVVRDANGFVQRVSTVVTDENQTTETVKDANENTIELILTETEGSKTKTTTTNMIANTIQIVIRDTNNVIVQHESESMTAEGGRVRTVRYPTNTNVLSKEYVSDQYGNPTQETTVERIDGQLVTNTTHIRQTEREEVTVREENEVRLFEIRVLTTTNDAGVHEVTRTETDLIQQTSTTTIARTNYLETVVHDMSTGLETYVVRTGNTSTTFTKRNGVLEGNVTETIHSANGAQIIVIKDVANLTLHKTTRTKLHEDRTYTITIEDFAQNTIEEQAHNEGNNDVRYVSTVRDMHTSLVLRTTTRSVNRILKEYAESTEYSDGSSFTSIRDGYGTIVRTIEVTKPNLMTGEVVQVITNTLFNYIEHKTMYLNGDFNIERKRVDQVLFSSTQTNHTTTTVDYEQDPVHKVIHYEDPASGSNYREEYANDVLTSRHDIILTDTTRTVKKTENDASFVAYVYDLRTGLLEEIRTTDVPDPQGIQYTEIRYRDRSITVERRNRFNELMERTTTSTPDEKKHITVTISYPDGSSIGTKTDSYGVVVETIEITSPTGSGRYRTIRKTSTGSVETLHANDGTTLETIITSTDERSVVRSDGSSVRVNYVDGVVVSSVQTSPPHAITGVVTIVTTHSDNTTTSREVFPDTREIIVKTDMFGKVLEKIEQSAPNPLTGIFTQTITRELDATTHELTIQHMKPGNVLESKRTLTDSSTSTVTLTETTSDGKVITTVRQEDFLVETTTVFPPNAVNKSVTTIKVEYTPTKQTTRTEVRANASSLTTYLDEQDKVVRTVAVSEPHRVSKAITQTTTNFVTNEVTQSTTQLNGTITQTVKVNGNVISSVKSQHVSDTVITTTDFETTREVQTVQTDGSYETIVYSKEDDTVLSRIEYNIVDEKTIKRRTTLASGEIQEEVLDNDLQMVVSLSRIDTLSNDHVQTSSIHLNNSRDVKRIYPEGGYVQEVYNTDGILLRTVREDAPNVITGDITSVVTYIDGSTDRVTSSPNGTYVLNRNSGDGTHMYETMFNIDTNTTTITYANGSVESNRVNDQGGVVETMTLSAPDQDGQQTRVSKYENNKTIRTYMIHGVKMREQIDDHMLRIYVAYIDDQSGEGYAVHKSINEQVYTLTINTEGVITRTYVNGNTETETITNDVTEVRGMDANGQLLYVHETENTVKRITNYETNEFTTIEDDVSTTTRIGTAEVLYTETVDNDTVTVSYANGSYAITESNVTTHYTPNGVRERVVEKTNEGTAETVYDHQNYTTTYYVKEQIVRTIVYVSYDTYSETTDTEGTTKVVTTTRTDGSIPTTEIVKTRQDGQVFESVSVQTDDITRTTHTVFQDDGYAIETYDLEAASSTVKRYNSFGVLLETTVTSTPNWNTGNVTIQVTKFDGSYVSTTKHPVTNMITETIVFTVNGSKTTEVIENINGYQSTIMRDHGEFVESIVYKTPIRNERTKVHTHMDGRVTEETRDEFDNVTLKKETTPRDDDGSVIITYTYLDHTIIKHVNETVNHIDYELTIELDSTGVETSRTERSLFRNTGITTILITTQEYVETRILDANGDIVRKVVETDDTRTTTDGDVTIVEYLSEIKTITVDSNDTRTITTVETDTSREVTTETPGSTVSETVSLLYTLVPVSLLLRTSKTTIDGNKVTNRVTENADDSFVETITVDGVLRRKNTRHPTNTLTRSYQFISVDYAQNTTETSTYFPDSSESVLRDASLTVLRTVHVSAPSAFIGMVTTTVIENGTRSVTETQKNTSYHTKVYDHHTDELIRTIHGTSPSFVHRVVTETIEWGDHKTIRLIQTDGSYQMKTYVDDVLVEEREKNDTIEIVKNTLTNEMTKTELKSDEMITTHYVNDEAQRTITMKEVGDLTIEVTITADKTITITSDMASGEVIETSEVQIPDAYTGKQTTLTNNFEFNYRIVSVTHANGRITITKTNRDDSELYQTITHAAPNTDGDVLIEDLNYQTNEKNMTTVHSDGSKEVQITQLSTNELLETIHTTRTNALNGLVTVTRHIIRTNTYEIKKTKEDTLVEDGVYTNFKQTKTNYETDRTYDITLDSMFVPIKTIESSTDNSIIIITEGNEQTQTITNSYGSSYIEKRISDELVETTQRYAPNINGNVITVITNMIDMSYVTLNHDSNGVLIQTAITGTPDEITGDRVRVVTRQDGSSFTMLIMRNGITRRLTSPIIQPITTNIGYMTTMNNHSILYDQYSEVVKTKSVHVDSEGVRTTSEIDVQTNRSITMLSNDTGLLKTIIEYPSEEGLGFYFTEEHLPNGNVNKTLHSASSDAVVSYNTPNIDVFDVIIRAE